MRDDILLISAVNSITSLNDYFIKLWDGYLYDIQPIRDLSFYLNLVLYKSFGYGGFHLTNVLLSLGIIILCRRHLKLMGFKEKSIILGLLLLSTHPLMNSITAWVSNRKHLLSVFFILLYGMEVHKETTSGWKTFLWSTLSFLSQPITIFIPLFYIIYKGMIEKRNLIFWDYLVAVMAISVLSLNYYLYNYNIRFLGRNAVNAINDDTGMYILRLGRIPVQLLFPVSLAAEYDIGNILNFFGIFLTVILVYLHFKFDAGIRKTVFYLIILSTLFPVLSWGVRDPYLLMSLLLTCGISVQLIDKFENKIITPAVLGVLLIFSFYSIKFTNMWKSDVQLYKVSTETEGGAENLYKYAIASAMADPSKAYEIYNDIMDKYPNLVNYLILAKKAEALYLSSAYSEIEKLNKFRAISAPDIFDVFFHAQLLKKLGPQNEYRNAMKALKTSLEDPYFQKIFKQIYCLQYVQACSELGLIKVP